MRALYTNSEGIESLELREVPEPPHPGPGEALVRPRAFSLNYRDLMVTEGRYGKPPEEAFQVGSDMAGEVLAVGEGVEHIKAGDKVLNAPITGWVAGEFQRPHMRTFLGAGGVPGVFAEQIVLPAQALVPFSRMSFSDAATLPIAGLTAWASVVTHGALRPGGTCVCLGTGGVSIFAAQLTHAMRANVIITSSSDEKIARIRRILGEGVAAINYTQFPEWHRGVLELTHGEGADLVVETVGGASVAKSLEAVRHGGRVCLVGVLAGADSAISVRSLLTRQSRLIGIFMESIHELRQLVRFVETWHIKPVIDRHFDFEEAPKAYAHLKSQKHFGKIVIDL